MKISVGTDHRGLEQKRIVAELCQSLGHEAVLFGATTTDSCDYPDVAAELGRSVSIGGSDFGILICGTGVGMSIAANKIKGVRAALCVSEANAKLSRQHNDANVLCVPGDAFDRETLSQMVTTWLATEFEGGRHARRVDKVVQLECGNDQS